MFRPSAACFARYAQSWNVRISTGSARRGERWSPTETTAGCIGLRLCRTRWLKVNFKGLTEILPNLGSQHT